MKFECDDFLQIETWKHSNNSQKLTAAIYHCLPSTYKIDSAVFRHMGLFLPLFFFVFFCFFLFFGCFCLLPSIRHLYVETYSLVKYLIISAGPTTLIVRDNNLCILCNLLSNPGQATARLLPGHGNLATCNITASHGQLPCKTRLNPGQTPRPKSRLFDQCELPLHDKPRYIPDPPGRKQW